MIHNANTRVKVELIKSMKPESMLKDIIAIAKSVESIIITEKLSKGDDKLQEPVDSVNKQGCSASKESHQYKTHSNSKGGFQKAGKPCNNCGKIHPQNSVLHFAKHAISAKRRAISLNFAVHVQAPDHHHIIKDNPIRIFMRFYNQRVLIVICSHMRLI